MYESEIIEALYKIKEGIEADNFTRENIDELIKRIKSSDAGEMNYETIKRV